MTMMLHAQIQPQLRGFAPQPEPSTFTLREEVPADFAAREALLDAAFGEARFAKTCERLREGRVPARGLAFIAEDDGEVVGTLRLWNVDAGGVAALMLGPLAVADSHRSLGLGGAMMRHALAKAKVLGHPAVILVGDAPYYARFGFARASAEGLKLPGPVDPARFLGLELEPGALQTARGMVQAKGRKVLPLKRTHFNIAA